MAREEQWIGHLAGASGLPSVAATLVDYFDDFVGAEAVFPDLTAELIGER